ncbi:hypothetical protein GCM10010412_099650 [Nonomuraea recticatena]|uniref:Uncharacterized protein n=1 Tax=Nonomuraea recticatena TaxID=46178 RepID=A0ABN3TG06_9ACTN
MDSKRRIQQTPQLESRRSAEIELGGSPLQERGHIGPGRPAVAHVLPEFGEQNPLTVGTRIPHHVRRRIGAQ